MRLGYFGGSFDPPHWGHLAVARSAAAAFQLDEVLFVPTGRQPLKPFGAAASFADRLEMVRLLCIDFADFKACDLEAPNETAAPSYTVETLHTLHKMLSPTDRIFLLLGADAFRELPRWRDPLKLLELAELVVLSRPQAPLEELEMPLSEAQRARIHLLPALEDPSASTTVRSALAAGADDAMLLRSLPVPVLRYIRSHGLYES